MATIDITDTRNADIIKDASDWPEAVDKVIAFWVSEGRPFSSGEIASALRVHRPELRFSVPTLGEKVRDRFYGHTMPEYPDPGDGAGTVFPWMTPRVTEGLYPDRTPAGTEVFVYARSAAEGQSHPFEVFIPRPKDGKMETMADAPAPAPTQTSQAQADTTGRTPTAVQILGARATTGDLRATVDSAGRLTVPRAAFEMAVAVGGTALQGGAPVFVKVTVEQAIITPTDDCSGGKPYSLTRDRGRVAFVSPDPTLPFKPGTAYRVKVEPGKLVIDLTAKV